VRSLLADVRRNGAGKRYLIQHSAGSGKSNSIAWLAHQLVGIEHASVPLFDSVVVVTDRRVLDRQIQDTIKQFAQVSAVVGHAERSGDLRHFLQAGKKIIITTVQKFPFILDEIGGESKGRSSHHYRRGAFQSGWKTTAAKNKTSMGRKTSSIVDEEVTLETDSSRS
jgi:type I restriction enzyme R subunit